MNPGVCCPPPTVPARVENFIPQGVISACSLFTIIIPPVEGSIAAIHSKHPQEVIGSVIILYLLIRSTLPPLVLRTNAFTLSHWPTVGSMQLPFEMGWFGPEGVISKAARQSSQLYAPHKPGRSGETTQIWFGAKL